MGKGASDFDSDEELLRAVSRGSEEAFVALYRRHRGSLLRFATHMTGKRETAEEIVQDIFSALLRSTAAFNPVRGSLEAYLIGAARNQVRQHLREAARHAVRKKPEAVTLPAVERDLDLAKLREAILSLPIKYREAVVMCDMEELDYEEAANRIGCPVGTVRSRLHRARAILLAKMSARRDELSIKKGS